MARRKAKAVGQSPASKHGVHQVEVTYKRFSPSSLEIKEGETVVFTWDEPSGNGLHITQVVHDGDGYRIVPGGLCSSQTKCNTGKYEVQLGSERVYVFSSGSPHNNCLRVEVSHQANQVTVTDDGFEPKTIFVNQGSTVQFTWQSCDVPRSVWSAHICMKHIGFACENMDGVIMTSNGSCQYDFDDPGTYYFQTQSREADGMHLCIVTVHQRNRDHSLVITDGGFEPRLLSIEEGDKVWFSWEKCKKKHHVYIIDASLWNPGNTTEPPPPFRGSQYGSSVGITEAFAPSNNGLLAHTFPEVGVHFFCDETRDDRAFKVGTIVVTSKHKQISVVATPEGFFPGVRSCQTGDQILWTWNPSDMEKHFYLKEMDKCLSPAPENEPDDDCQGACEPVSGQHLKQMSEVGMQSTTIKSIGVYYYGATNGEPEEWATVVCQPAPMNHIVDVTDNGFEPNKLAIKCNDLVWFRWRDTVNHHNITEVSFCGVELTQPRFSSKIPRASPSSFMHQFCDEGIYYYNSSTMKKATGAIVVTRGPVVHTLSVPRDGLPGKDPCIVSENDVVCWQFHNPVTHNVLQIVDIEDVPETLANSQGMPRRLCMSKSFPDSGLFHFCSKSFKSTATRRKPIKALNGRQEEETFTINSVVVQESYFSHTVRVDSGGFYPHTITVKPRQTVSWTWMESDGEMHNIARVTAPDSVFPLIKVEGNGEFSSGETTESARYLQTFEDPTSYYVISEGAPGHSSAVKVVKDAEKVSVPYIDYNEVHGGTVALNHTILLACNTPEVNIYYTTDGSVPLPFSHTAKKYSDYEGAVLDTPGLTYLRAAACKDGYITSDIFTSQRFLVVPSAYSESATTITVSEGALSSRTITAFDDEVSGLPGSDETEAVLRGASTLEDRKVVSLHQAWLLCNPSITLHDEKPGEIVITWHPVEHQFSYDLIKGYKLHINEVVYHSGLISPPETGLHVCGLAGGRAYDIVLEVFHKEPHMDSQLSNPLVYPCPPIVPGGGPLISLKVTEEDNAFCIVWKPITASGEAIAGYQVYLNDEKLGPLINHEGSGDECSALITDCQEREYRVFVTAVVSGREPPERKSNVLHVLWPLQLYAEGEVHSYDREIIQVYSADTGSTSHEDDTDAQSLLQDQVSQCKQDPSHGSGTSTKQLTDFGWGVTPPRQEPSAATKGNVAALLNCESNKENEPVATGVAQVEMNAMDTNKPSEEAFKNQLPERPQSEDSSYDGKANPSSTGAAENPVVIAKAVVLNGDNKASQEVKNASEIRDASQHNGQNKPTEVRVQALPTIRQESLVGQSSPQDHTSKPTEISMKRTPCVVEIPEDKRTVQIEPHAAPHKSGGVVIQLSDAAEEEDNSSMSGNPVAASQQAALPAAESPEAVLNLMPPADIYVIPKITHQPDGELMEWEMSRHPGKSYELISYAVYVTGKKFKDVHSNMSCECLDELGISSIQHVWHTGEEHHCLLKGLENGELYKIQVLSTWARTDKKNKEVQVKSDVITYKTIGAPSAPVLKVIKTDIGQVTFEWTRSSSDADVKICGYAVTVNRVKVGKVLSPDTLVTTLDKLVPGQTVDVNVVAVTNHAVGDSLPSNTVTVTCPVRPAAPLIVQQPSFVPRAVLISWEPSAAPASASSDSRDGVTYYAIYIDEKLYGEVPASQKANRERYQYSLVQLEPGCPYEVTLQAVAGQKMVDGSVQDHVYCLTASSSSNILPVVCAAPPVSPHVFIDSMSSSGIDVLWEPPQQLGEAVVTGYQLFKNDHLYHQCTSLPTSPVSFQIKDIKLGENVTLQVIALTDHPVGSGADPDLERFAQCKPGPKVLVQFTGLLRPPANVRCEKVSGHSALITWSKPNERNVLEHIVLPEYYQITWWPGQPGEQPDKNINSTSTTDYHVELNDLLPDCLYMVVVEARRRHQYTVVEDNVSNEATSRTTIVTARLEKNLEVRTGKPPSPATNLGVIASTCHSIQLGWDPPKQNGVEVKAIRVDCIPVTASDAASESTCIDLLPDAKSVVLTSLHERTQYKITVTAVTDEFFDQLSDENEWKASRILPLKPDLPSSKWLPKSSTTATTSGTVPPTSIMLDKITEDSARVSWKPAVVIGNNRLRGYIVRWSLASGFQSTEAFTDYIELHVKETKATISNLQLASRYIIVVEAVVSVKTVLEPIDGDEDKNRRTAHVPSLPLVIATRAPVHAPTLYVSSFSLTTVQLFWEKPALCTAAPGGNDSTSRCIRRTLEGYTLSVNGKHLMNIDSSEQSCTLVKCKPGKCYHIVLVALTTPRFEKVKQVSGLDKGKNLIALDNGFDESLPSHVDVQVPELSAGHLESLAVSWPESSTEENDCSGSLKVEWTAQGSASDVSQWIVTCLPTNGGAPQTLSVRGDVRQYLAPAKNAAHAYEISVRAQFAHKDSALKPLQKVSLPVPRAPEAPILFLDSCNGKEFRIEWSEPICHGNAPIDGYQIYVDDRKHGSLIDPKHHKAVMPCKPKRHYRVHVCAISKCYGSSERSNVVSVVTQSCQAAAQPAASNLISDTGDWEPYDQTDLFVRSTQVADTSARIEWEYESHHRDVQGYAVVWSSLVQAQEREDNVPADTNQLLIRGLLPGTTHFFQVKALGTDGHVLEKSKKLEVQTCAAPDPPVVRVKAKNFTYISINWETPKTYGLASIVGYKVMVDGVVKETKAQDQLCHTFSGGEPCRMYVYQVVAVSSVSDLASRPSDPLFVQWPGLTVPTLRQSQTDANAAVRVSWDLPICTEGVKIKHFKVVCREQQTNKHVQTISPIHPADTESELHGLRRGVYSVLLEIHVVGSDEIFKTEALYVEPLLFPDAPKILVTVNGIEERQELEALAALLTSRRYRLMSALAEAYVDNSKLQNARRMTKESLYINAKTREYLRRVESILAKCLEALAARTGSVTADLSWACPQTSPDVAINGYRIMVNGKEFGVMQNSSASSATLKLGIDEPVHRISVVAVAEKPYGVSSQSNVQEVTSTFFQPYASFCYSSVHHPDERLYGGGCCCYDLSLNYEKQRQSEFAWPAQKCRLLNVQLPMVQVTDMFENKLMPLYGPLVGSNKPTVLLFWTPWCLASQHMMKYLAKYALSNSHKYGFIAFASNTDMDDEYKRHQVMHKVIQNSWNEDRSVWHVGDMCLAPAAAIQEFIQQPYKKEMEDNHQDILQDTERDISSDMEKTAFGNLSALLGLAGVPSLVILQPTAAIAWMGTFRAPSYEQFNDMLTHHLFVATGDECPVTSCSTCASNAQLQGLLEKTGRVGLEELVGLASESSLLRALQPLAGYDYFEIPNSLEKDDRVTASSINAPGALIRINSKRLPVRLTASRGRRPASASSTRKQQMQSAYLSSQ